MLNIKPVWGAAALLTTLGALAIVACSDEATSGTTIKPTTDSGVKTDSGGGGGGDSGGGGGGDCKVTDGTYNIKVTRTAGDAEKCAEAMGLTATYPTPPSDAGGDGGLAEGCTSTNDPATCTTTIDCDFTTSGVKTVSKTVLKVTGGVPSMSTSSKQTMDGDGGSTVIYDCAFDWTYTKK